MSKRQLIGSLSWVAGGNLPFQLQNLPSGHKCRKIVLNASLTCTKDNADTLAAEKMPLAFSSVRIPDMPGGMRVNTTGFLLEQLNRAKLGKYLQNRSAISAGSGTATIIFNSTIMFADDKSSNPDESAIPCELFAGRTLDVGCAAATVWGGTSWSINSGTIDCYAEIYKSDSKGVPVGIVIDYKGAQGQTLSVEPGIYRNLIAIQLDATKITDANISNIIATFDGEAIINNLKHVQLVDDYNIDACIDNTAEFVSAGAGDYALPILHTRRTDTLLTKLPCSSQQGSQVQFTGTLTAPVVCYEKVLLMDKGSQDSVLVAQGVDPSAVEVEARSAKASPIETQAGTKKAAIVAAALPKKAVHPAVAAKRSVSPVSKGLKR